MKETDFEAFWDYFNNHKLTAEWKATIYNYACNDVWKDFKFQFTQFKMIGIATALIYQECRALHYIENILEESEALDDECKEVYDYVINFPHLNLSWRIYIEEGYKCNSEASEFVLKLYQEWRGKQLNTDDSLTFLKSFWREYDEHIEYCDNANLGGYLAERIKDWYENTINNDFDGR